MPWKEVSTMSLRKEFVTLAATETIHIRELCRRFGVSPRTGYKWLGRYCLEGAAGSRRPHRSPICTPPELEAAVVALRLEHPAWGGRKIKAWMVAQRYSFVPSPSTITAILHRHGLIDEAEAAHHRPTRGAQPALADGL